MRGQHQRNENTMSMQKAAEVMAEHLARKAAKKKGTDSERYVEGYKDAVLDLAKHPMPAEADMLAALDAKIAELPDKDEGSGVE